MIHKRSLYALIGVLSLLIIAGLAANPKVRAAPIADQTQADTTFAHFYLFRATASPTPWWGTSTRVDASGGVHTAFYTNQHIYYVHCSADCDNTDNWSGAPIADTGSYDSLTHPVVAVDASGHPRLLWWYSDDYYVYAQCNADCDEAAHWTSVQVSVAEPSGYTYPQTPRYFVIDSQGRPRFATYGYGGFQYTTCDANCTSAANWQSTLLDLGESIDRPQLVLNGNDQPRVMGANVDSDLVYFECNTNCSQAANWQHVTLPYTVNDVYFESSYSFRLDGLGRPRIAFYDLVTGNTTLRYAWSNSNTLSVAGWSSYGRPGSPADYRTVDLAFDSQNRPHVVFDSYQTDVSLRYWACTANCETGNSTWQEQNIETGDELDITDPIPPAGCIASTWATLGEYPSLALDATDRPNVSYYVVHSKMCLGGDGQYHILHDVWALRFARPIGSTTPTAPSSVTPIGPALGVVGHSYTFTATVSPLNATLPITYVWQATGQTAQTHTGRGANDTATFTWPSGVTGVKTITVTVSNRAGTAHGSNTILITQTPIVFNHWVYLPAIIRQ